MRVRICGSIVDSVTNIACLEKEIDRAVDYCLVWQDVLHFAFRHLAYSRANMIVIAHVTTRSDGDFRNSHLVLALEVGQMPPVDGGLVENSCFHTLSVDLERFIRMRG